jgi:AcrR family transcriptional regulator
LRLIWKRSFPKKLDMITETEIAPMRLRGRPREFDMEAALDKALAVFAERGYHAASITDLTSAMGLAAGSVYKAFKDKRGIFLAAFDRYRAVRVATFDEAIAGAYNGRDKLLAVLRVYADSSHGAIGKRGCLVVRSADDLALLDDEAASRVATAFNANETLVTRLIALGQEDGSIRADLDVQTTARTLLCLMSGMRVVGKTGRSHAEMAAVAEAALGILD